MQQLSSKNYSRVLVTLRNESDKIIMPRLSGDKLMQFITSDQVTKHATITDIDGLRRTVHVSEIVSIEPEYKTEYPKLSEMEIY